MPITPEVNEAGKATRFKKGNVPAWKSGKSPNKPQSIRYWLKVFAEEKIDVNDLDNEIKRLLQFQRHKKSEMAKVVALRMYEKVIKRMDAKLVSALIDNLEGKLVQATVEVPMRKAPESMATSEEAEQAYAEFIKM